MNMRNVTHPVKGSFRCTFPGLPEEDFDIINGVHDDIARLNRMQLREDAKTELNDIMTDYDNMVVDAKANQMVKLANALATKPAMAEIARHLTMNKLISDIEDAMDLKTGYFKSLDGKRHVYIKGIEVDGSCSLLRGGFNAEDHGVYVHYAEVDDSRIASYDMPLVMVHIRMTDKVKETERLIPSTKEEFDAAVQRATENAIKDVNFGYSCQDWFDYLQQYANAYAESEQVIVDKGPEYRTRVDAFIKKFGIKFDKKNKSNRKHRRKEANNAELD